MLQLLKKKKSDCLVSTQHFNHVQPLHVPVAGKPSCLETNGFLFQHISVDMLYLLVTLILLHGILNVHLRRTLSAITCHRLKTSENDQGERTTLNMT